MQKYQSKYIEIQLIDPGLFVVFGKVWNPRMFDGKIWEHGTCSPVTTPLPPISQTDRGAIYNLIMYN